jgi:site-specific DNA recombinase
MAANPHPQTKNVYELRSYVRCTPCQRRMRGHATRHGTAYAYCQPRNRALPENHPSAIRVREDELIDDVTLFLNRYVLGPDRLALAQAGMPAANDFVRGGHLKAEAALRQRLAELNGSMNNLMRVLERSSDPDGQLYQRTERRMAELGQEFSAAEKRLREHLASAPPEPDQNAGLLEHLPQLGVDLNLLTPERLRVFLEAFRVEIHYDVRTGRAIFRAELAPKRSKSR